MVRHDFHFDDLEPLLFCDLPEHCFHQLIQPVYQDPAPIFWAENNVAFAVINQMWGAVVFRCHGMISNRFIV